MDNMPGNAGAWPPAALALLDRAIAAHGGTERWAAVASLQLRLISLRGLVPYAKGQGHTFPLPSRIEIVPSRWRAVLHDYPLPGERGVFDRGVVSLVGSDGVEQVRAADHRRRFRGLRKYRRWRPLDALYFFGYALTHYHAVPFTLGEARFIKFRPARRPGAWDALTVEFPPQVHTHCRRQTYFFDREGLIQRHDYVADIVGAWARGCHFWRDFVRVGGLAIAQQRHVTARAFGMPLPLTALAARLADAAVSFHPLPGLAKSSR